MKTATASSRASPCGAVVADRRWCRRPARPGRRGRRPGRGRRRRASRAAGRPGRDEQLGARGPGPSMTVARAHRLGSARSDRRRPSRVAQTSLGRSPVERLEEEVDRAAAGEADGEGVVVAVAEGDELAVAGRAAISSASVTTAPSTQPPDTEPGHLAVLVHRHGRARGPGPGALDVDDPGQGDPPPSARQRSRSSRISLMAASAHGRLAVIVRAASLGQVLQAMPASGPRRSSSTWGRAAAMPRASGA